MNAVSRIAAVFPVLPALPGKWSVYLLSCADGALYCGISTDCARRFRQHGTGRGARYTRMNRPLAMRILLASSDRKTAAALEYRIKQLAAADKQLLWSWLPETTI